MKVTVTYIKHSGFAVELPEKTLLFDYYAGDLSCLPADKPLYVFASHRHHDHFDPCVFDLARGRENVRYILSNDIRARQAGCVIDKLGPRKCLETGGMRVETLKSTDEGVAFLVETEGVRLYHAGDLNLWTWDEETPEYNARMTQAYHRELDRSAGRQFDLAFLPLDPRQEQDRENGLRAFLDVCGAGHIFPMHCWEDYSVIDSLRAAAPSFAGRICRITAPGQRFVLDLPGRTAPHPHDPEEKSE